MKIKKQKFINIVIILVALIAIGLGAYFYYQLKVIKTSPETIAKKEAIDLVSKVSKLYLLPIGEDPTVATVSDPEVLKSQSFFTQSEKGDKVLIYTKAGKAILYRPNIDKIIETAPISNNPKVDSTTTQSTTPTSSTTKTTTKKQ